MSEDVTRAWLKKQAICQIYLLPPQHIPRPKFDVVVPNEVHRPNLLFLPHDRLPRGGKTHKYALTIVDVASHYKEAEPVPTKEAKDAADALSRIYRRSPLFSRLTREANLWERSATCSLNMVFLSGAAPLTSIGTRES